jgi:hypothetical protein
MSNLLGTVVASPIVQGASSIDAYGTHYAFLGVGGYQEYLTIAERDAIQIDPLNRLGDDGLSSGRRRLGMLVYVPETDIVYKLTIPYATWTGLTTANKVAALGNNANWQPFSSGGGGDAIKKKYTQGLHGFTVGTVVAFNGSSFVPKLSNSSDPNETLGIVSKIDDPNNFTVTYSGFIDTTPIVGLSANTTYFVSASVPGAITPFPPINLGDENRPILITQTPTTGLVVQYRGQIITENVISGSSGTTFVAGVIGPAEDGTYSDGLFTDFVPSTPTGTAIDRFNEILKSLAPPPAPSLTNINNTPALNSAKLSFGVTRNDVGFNNVTVAAGNTAVDINGSYVNGGTRIGVTNTFVTGQINSGVPLTPFYAAGAFDEGDKGKLVLNVNGVDIANILLSGSTGASSNTWFTISAVFPVTFSNGNPFPTFKYRTGSYIVNTADMVSGFNYARVLHVKPSGTVQTNYLEWVYDPNATTLSVSSTSLSGLVLTGSRWISGVRYNTGGTVTYNTTLANGFRTVYPNGNAISFPNRINLSDAGIISKTGTGITTDISASRTFPALNTAVVNPQATSMVIASAHVLQNNILGNIGALGKIETNVSFIHPLKATFTGGIASTTGFLQYTNIQSNNLKVENFTGEINRIQDRDYTSLTYANIDGGTYAWDGTQSLVGLNAQHNTGLLVFNGELMYPNTTYLNSTYGISAGNFGGVTNILAGNPNYSTASGVRVYDRKFKSTNAVTQASLTIEFLHTGTNSSFLLDFSTPSSNFIRVEVMIKRSGGATHGWFNPFASIGNPEGIANTAISTIAGGTSVSCTLSTVPRIGNGDIVIVRIYASASWTNRISNINVVNI